MDRAITVLEKAQHPDMVARMLTHYSSGALTTATLKWEWVVPYYARIIDVLIDAEASAGVGNGKNTIDVNINGTTIFTDQDSRPYLDIGDSGLFRRGAIEVSHVVPGDIISYDVDAVPATSGATRVKVCIVLGPR